MSIVWHCHIATGLKPILARTIQLAVNNVEQCCIFHKSYLMCSQMTDVVMGLVWLTQLHQLILSDSLSESPCSRDAW